MKDSPGAESPSRKNTYSSLRLLGPRASRSGCAGLGLLFALSTITQPALPGLCAPVSQAAQTTQTNRGAKPIADKWAVVIGCSRFADSRVPTLKYSAKDAQDFANFLTDPQGGRFKKDHVKVLTNEDATKI